MAKKNRYTRRTSTKQSVKSRPRPSEAAAPAPSGGQAVAAATAQAAANSTAGTKKVVDFGQEYQYVVSDLKRVGILAVALIVLLIVLSFVL